MRHRRPFSADFEACLWLIAGALAVALYVFAILYLIRSRTMETEPIITPSELEAADPAKHPLDLSPRELTARMKRVSTNREMLLAWVKGQLVNGVDYGSIHWPKKPSAAKNPNSVVCDKGESCTISWHWSKPAMRKPGAEKITALFGFRPHWPDLEEIVRSVSVGNVMPASVLLRCHVLNRHGQIMGEGIGGRETRFDGVNKAFKMAKKSSHIDAVLVTFGLSELFTQDFGDPDDAEPETGDFMVTAEVCPIGNYRGHAWEEIPDRELDRLREYDEVPDDLKARARDELERRREWRVTVTEEPKRLAENAGDWSMRAAAEAILAVQSLAELETLLEEIPEKYKTPQARTIERVRTALEQA